MLPTSLADCEDNCLMCSTCRLLIIIRRPLLLDLLIRHLQIVATGSPAAAFLLDFDSSSTYGMQSGSIGCFHRRMRAKPPVMLLVTAPAIELILRSLTASAIESRPSKSMIGCMKLRCYNNWMPAEHLSCRSSIENGCECGSGPKLLAWGNWSLFVAIDVVSLGVRHLVLGRCIGIE